MAATTHQMLGEDVQIPFGYGELEGNLRIPGDAWGVVLFAHGSGSSRFSSRNQFVAHELNDAGIGTLLMDLLTADEERQDEFTRELRFDIDLLAERLMAATDWLGRRAGSAGLPVGYFGASTGGGAALVAAAQRPDAVRCVVSRGGRPDLAGAWLAQVRSPTLLIVGGHDDVVIELNRRALRQLTAVKELTIVPGATHLFEEPGALEQVSRLAIQWFVRHLPADEEGGGHV